jgi:hypothetical protein
MQSEDALKYIIAWLRGGAISGQSYGYDLYLPLLIREYVRVEESWEKRSAANSPIENRINEHSPLFFAAAWELCRRGVLRPGVRILGAQSTEVGNSGCGYSVTPFGRAWLSESTADDFVPTEPERFGRLLSPYRDRFGAGYHDRAQQAVRCYGAHAYLACCAMCGAAAESVLLAVAIAKTSDESKVLREYRAANGRSKIEALILGDARQRLQSSLRAFTESLKYWRDESAHGLPSTISDEQAYTSLAMMLRLSQFATDNWQELTQP